MTGIRKIAIVGSESTGKSLLAQQLAAHYKTRWVPEVARDYLNNLGRNYTYEDLSIIAQQQLMAEDQEEKNANQFLFCDTNLIVIKVWSDFKYNKTEPWIVEEIKTREYALHILCDIDLPWEDDPLREHPQHRKELFAIYENELRQYNLNYALVSGLDDVRLKNALQVMQKQFLGALH